MAPVLLDQQSIFKAGIAITLAMCMVYFIGYSMGFNKAGAGRNMEFNKSVALALPKPAHADTAEYEPYTPRQLLPGASIDVDSPDPAAAENEGNVRPASRDSNVGGNVESVIELATTRIEPTAGNDSPAPHENHQLQLASTGITPVFSYEAGSEAVVIKQADDSNSTVVGADTEQFVLDTSTAEEALYTIQVGVFADSENALRRKSELESQRLNAYISEYKNRRDELRFNVRFGYFNNRSSAIAALESFQHNMSGDGYVTRIRRN
jgi:cell division protein FtsN